MKAPSCFLVFTLTLLLDTNLHARPSLAESSPSRTSVVHAEWFDFVPVSGRPSRTTVVRVTALAMALALAIMFRSKY